MRTVLGSGLRRTARRVTAVLALLAVSAGLVTATAAPAQASSWQLHDGFELNPASTWQVNADIDGSAGGFEIGAGTARSGSNNAWLVTETSWSSVGRSVRLTPALHHQPTCGATVYLSPITTVTVLVEVIDPSTWTYISLKTVTLSASGYTAVNTPSWKPGPSTVYVRISLAEVGLLSGVRIDDLYVQCWGYY